MTTSKKSAKVTKTTTAKSKMVKKAIKTKVGLTAAPKVGKSKILVVDKSVCNKWCSKDKCYQLDSFRYDRLMEGLVCLVQDMDKTLSHNTPLEIEDIVVKVKYKSGPGVKDMRLMVNGSHKNSWRREKDMLSGTLLRVR